jgi:hypothetical protein
LINYTERLTLLMQDIVSRVPTLSFIDMRDVLVFARSGRTNADGAFATCHCLSLPTSEPGYYFWKDRETGRITRRSEWFVTKSPVVTMGERPINYLISFTMPRYCDQTLDRSRKERYYRRASDNWMAKLDTVVHELYHIDPEQSGIRRIERTDGTSSPHCHTPRFFEEVAQMVGEYLDTNPDPIAYDFLRYDFATLESLHERVVGTSFRTFPSYPQRFIEALETQPPCDVDLAGVEVAPVRPAQQLRSYTEEDLYVRHFLKDTSRRLAEKGAARPARRLPFRAA